MSVKILVNDCVESMKAMPDQSVHCCVTSPPYWGLRDYGHDGQIGLEHTPEAYVSKMVEVFREVRRVLRDDGTLWLNLGDSYAQSEIRNRNGESQDFYRPCRDGVAQTGRKQNHGLKPKDLVGIPWRVAFALQADGWWLRQDIIWHKPNPMPESVTDRCTKAHEYIFLMTKSDRYFYDADAINEISVTGVKPTKYGKGHGGHAKSMGRNPSGNERPDATPMSTASRNRRSVWTITTRPYSGAHFATFPPDLVEPCIQAGTSEEGCCPACGTPWERVVDIESPDGRRAAVIKGNKAYDEDGNPLMGDNMIDHGVRGSWNSGGKTLKRTTTGWRPGCECGGDPVPCTVLDPFGGAGTTGLVADQLGRNAILCELNPEYANLAENRIRQDSPMFSDVMRT